ncbi:hypothetical protein pEaSNUABM46_00201 [Erwinia phage pEa_SNUABM_46]|nr:hypothetical protein pEaSNUABM45_00201 [Erwinia phage pEa_SNUABM_45]QYW04185.1 hypothetical protein pEaSNUABM46_00201 [Erwinia phage pEa_SNUABM_46]
MSIDYQFLILFLMVVSADLRPLVCGGFTKPLNIYHLIIVEVLIVLVGIFVIEMPQMQLAFTMIVFAALGGMSGALYDCFLKPYVQSRFMQHAYCAHIGFWSGLFCYSIRWLF